MTERRNDVAIFKKQKRIKEQKMKRMVASVALSKSAKAKGDSGQYQFQSNDLTSEFDPLLMGREGTKQFVEMSKSDGIVGGMISAYMNLILSCNWGLQELVDPTPEEEKVKEVLDEWLFDKNNFEPQLLQILRMLPIGFSLFNKYYTPFDYDNNRYMMPVMLERMQQSIWRIDYDGEYVEQITSKGTTVTIDFKDLVFFTFRQEGNDRRGVSLLRQAYYDWLDKVDVKSIIKKGIVRNMLGLPIGKVPIGVKTDSPEYDLFCDVIDNLSSRDSVDTDDSVILPEKYELEMFETSFKINDLRDYLGYYDSSMAISVLTQFLLLGQQGGGGSYSLNDSQSDFFLAGLHFIIDYITGQYTREIITPTVKSNWENIDYSKYRLQGTNLSKKATDVFAKTLDTLVKSGILKVQKSDEEKIREMYGLSEINDKEREEQEEESPPEPPAAPSGENEPEDDEGDDESTDDIEENSLMSMKEIPIVEFWSNGKERDSYIDQEVESLSKYSRTSLQIIADRLISSIRFQLKASSPQSRGLKDVNLNKSAVSTYKKNMGQRLSAITLKAWDNAKTKSKPHLEKMATNPSDLPNKTLTSFVINQSDLTVENQVSTMRDRSLLIANTASSKGYGIEQTLAQVEAGLDDFVDSQKNVELASMTSITQAVSYGEMAYYKSIDDDLWGYVFENVSPKTDICRSLVGKTYRKDSSAMEMVSPPLHFRCKSFFEPIYKTEAKPEYDDYIPAPSVLKEKVL